jgi:hypothetical protein
MNSQMPLLRQLPMFSPKWQMAIFVYTISDHCILICLQEDIIIIEHGFTNFKCVKRIDLKFSNMITHDNMIPWQTRVL